MTKPAAASDAVDDDDVRGLYGPGSEAWALNREAMLLLGAGPRALLLQLAHPQVAAGVADHSDFRVDPWARLRGTLSGFFVHRFVGCHLALGRLVCRSFRVGDHVLAVAGQARLRERVD